MFLVVNRLCTKLYSPAGNLQINLTGEMIERQTVLLRLISGHLEMFRAIKCA